MASLVHRESIKTHKTLALYMQIHENKEQCATGDIFR